MVLPRLHLPPLIVALFALGVLCSTACSQDRPKSNADSTSPAVRESADEWVVMTWNLEWFFDDHRGDNYGKLPKQQSAPNREAWNWRRDAIADSIATVRPDVLAVQEVEGQRVLFYLRQAIERRHQTKYSIGFAEGGDYFTEQDVGFLYGPRLDLTRLSRRLPTRAMVESDQYHNVSKHLEATFEIPVGDTVERVTILTLHLRAGSDTAEIRGRQSRLVHAWLSERIAAGENVIVLGDTNSESTAYPPATDSDIAALRGRGTPATDDDLIDLHEYLPSDERQTHLLRGKHFDRILVSRSLMEDAPGRPDLVFGSIERPRQLAVRGAGVDPPDEHWERYWEMPERERDLSDHWPVVARFTVK